MQPPRVLCIDDFIPGLETRKVFLEQFGFQVWIASSGLEGLRLLEEKQMDAVILDYRMPEMNGYEVAVRIREDFGSLPILLLSGFASIPTELKQIVTCHLIKGDPPALLLAALDEITGTTADQRNSLVKVKSAQGPDPQSKRKTS